MSTVRRSVSVAIHHAERPGLLLLVRRPPDDDALPNAWGLPAASLREDESWADAALRAGAEKLGVRLLLGEEINRGSSRRPGFILEMRLFEALIATGTPTVPQPVPDVTQYTGLRWGRPADLQPAARRGSLCCRLFLEHSRRPPDT